ncbi:MAG: WG repeat-containing protein [Clostridiales bacterium]
MDQYGQVVVEPHWDEYQPNTFNTMWPISRVKKNDRFGYVDDEGNIIISVKWDYAAMETILLTESEMEIPVIYVYDGEDWGGIIQNDNGQPSRVDWDLVPDEAYQTANTPHDE